MASRATTSRASCWRRRRRRRRRRCVYDGCCGTGRRGENKRSARQEHVHALYAHCTGAACTGNARGFGDGWAQRKKSINNTDYWFWHRRWRGGRHCSVVTVVVYSTLYTHTHTPSTRRHHVIRSPNAPLLRPVLCSPVSYGAATPRRRRGGAYCRKTQPPWQVGEKRTSWYLCTYIGTTITDASLQQLQQIILYFITAVRIIYISLKYMKVYSKFIFVWWR